MKNKLFIALDIDGVLNSNQDHLKLAELQQSKDILGMVEALQNEIKFSKTTKGGLCYGNLVNRHQLKLLNDFINKMIQQDYDIHIVGISSWFSTNPNDIMLLNCDRKELYEFFEFHPSVTFHCANYTIGVSHKRLESLIAYIESVINGNQQNIKDEENKAINHDEHGVKPVVGNTDKSNIICLYLDDLRHDNVELFNQQLSNFKNRNPNIQWFYPKITERFGLQQNDLDVNQ